LTKILEYTGFWAILARKIYSKVKVFPAMELYKLTPGKLALIHINKLRILI